MSAERRGTATQGDEPIGSHVEKREEGHVGWSHQRQAPTQHPQGSERPLHPAGCRGCVTGSEPWVGGAGLGSWLWLECGG